MSIKLQLLPPPTLSSSSTTPLKIKVLPSTKISAFIHTYVVKSKLPLSQKQHLSVWLEDEELELGATVQEEEISSGEKLRIVYREKKDKGKGRAVDPVVVGKNFKSKGKKGREEKSAEEEVDELDEGSEWDDASLREADKRAGAAAAAAAAAAPTTTTSRPPSSSFPSSKHLKPSTSAANSTSTSIVQLATLHPRPKATYTSTTYLTYNPPPKRQKFRPLVPNLAASVAEEEEQEEDDFDSLFPDDLLASIDLPTTTTAGLPSTPPLPVPQAPPNTPNYLPSPSRLLALQERLSAAPASSSSPSRRDDPSPSSSSSRSKRHRPRLSPPSPHPSSSKSRAEPPPPSPPPLRLPTPRLSHPPSSTSSSSTAAVDKLAKFRYVAPPLPPSNGTASPSPQPPPAKPPSSPPRSTTPASYSSSSKPKPKPVVSPPHRLRSQKNCAGGDDFFSSAVDPLDGYERVKEEEVEVGLDVVASTEELRSNSNEPKKDDRDIDKVATTGELEQEEEEMVLDFWGTGGMVKKGEESGPPASFVAVRERRVEGDGEKDWVQEEGGGSLGLGFEGDDGKEWDELGSGGVTARAEEEEEEEVDELEGDGESERGVEAMEGAKTLGLEVDGSEMEVDESEMVGVVDLMEKRVMIPISPTLESLPRPDRPLNNPPQSTSNPALPSRNLSILNLPSSILNLILLQTIDPLCLSNLSILLTSKLFHSIARPILYRVVSLRSTQGWKAFFASGSSTELRTSSGNARRKEDYDAVEELEIHAEPSTDASDLTRIDMVLAFHDISSKRGRKPPFIPNSTPFLPKLTKLTLSFPPDSLTNSLDYSATLKPFHPAFLKALSFPTPTLEITLIGVRNSDQVRAVFGTVQGVKKVVLERPIQNGKNELSEMARRSGGRIEAPAGEEGWVSVEKVEEWRKKSVWVGML